MIVTVVIWVYIVFIAYIYGWFLFCLISRLSSTQDPEPGAPIIMAAGLCTLTTFASFISLFMSISMTAHLIVLAGAITILIWGIFSHTLRFPKIIQVPTTLNNALLIILFLVITVNILENATHYPSNPDTGIYHAQAIRWIETYPVIPGLGNLHTRFAYNSSWLVLNALFSFSFFRGQSFHLLGSAIFLISTFYFFSGLSQIINNGPNFSAITKLLLIPLSFITLASEISSPGTDLPAILLTWVIICEWLTLIEDRSESNSSHYILLLLLSIYCITIKLSTAPILLLPALVLIKNIINKKWLSILITAVSGLLILSPWIIRNIFISGYIAYPQTFFDFFNFDWKIPYEFVRDEQISIMTWARNTALPSSEAIKLPFFTWVQIWYSKLTINRRLILLIPLVMPFIYAAFLFLFPQKTTHTKKLIKKNIAVYGLCYIGILFWFLSAPGYRFGYSFLIITLACTLSPLFLMVLQSVRNYKKYLMPLLLLILIIFQTSTLIKSFELETIGDRILLPMDYHSLPTSPCSGYNFQLFCADFYSECWYEPFPCIPYANPAVGLRGNQLTDGFKVYDTK